MIKDRQSKSKNISFFSVILLISISVAAATILIALHPTIQLLSLNEVFAQQDNNWYVGEGVKKDMYVKYRISHFDTNNGREFTMVIYFKEQDDKGNWIAPVYVEDQGNVLNGTFILSPLDLTALGTSDIPPEMAKYRSAYAKSFNG